MAAHGRRNLECGEYVRTPRAANPLWFWLADGSDLNVSHQPFRSVRVAAGLAVPQRAPFHAAEVPFSRPLPRSPASFICGMAARVLVGASDEFGASGLRNRYYRVHSLGD